MIVLLEDAESNHYATVAKEDLSCLRQQQWVTQGCLLVQDKSDSARLVATHARFSYPSSAEDSYRASDKSGASVVAGS